jgi:hypothetical protein
MIYQKAHLATSTLYNAREQLKKLFPLGKRTPERDGLLILIWPWIMVIIAL